MSELVETINTYRIELDKTRGNMEDLARRYENLESRYESLETLNRGLKSQNEDLERRLRQLARQNEAAPGTTTYDAIKSRPETTASLTIMPPPSSRDLVQRSVNPPLAQQHIDHLSDHFNHFFQGVDIWAKNYATTPAPAALQPIKQKFKERHMNLTISSQLLHDPDTARHTITKLILFAFMDATFQPRCFAHFKPEFGEQLHAERHKLYSGIPSNERKLLAQARVGVINMFVRDPEWNNFLNKFVSDKCSKLWQLLQPVFGTGAGAADAWPSFVGLFRQAVSIALTMHRRVCLFRIGFPHVGEGSAFNPAEMTKIGPTTDEGPRPGATGPQRLKLSITPVIRKTVLEESGAIGATVLICKAKVISE